MRSEEVWNCRGKRGGGHSKSCVETHFLPWNMEELQEVSHKYDNCVIQGKKTLKAEAALVEWDWLILENILAQGKTNHGTTDNLKWGGSNIYSKIFTAIQTFFSIPAPFLTSPLMFSFLTVCLFFCLREHMTNVPISSLDGEIVSYQTVSVAEKLFP